MDESKFGGLAGVAWEHLKGVAADMLELEDGEPSDYVAKQIDDLLSDEKRLIPLLQACGAALLGRRSQLTDVERRILQLVGKKVQRDVELEHADPTARSEQQRHIAVVSKRKICKAGQLQAMDPIDFEYWVAGYFQAHKFRDVWVTKASRDFGIDIEMKHPKGAPVVVQCKRYRGLVGRPVVQQTYGVMHLVGAKWCYVVTTGRFTTTARELQQGHPDICLVDGAELLVGANARPVRR
jgi:restriction system protein